ncbi:MAG: DUF389 domain-containing protein [Bacteroidia bacterium]|nr:DUF389 domain-containing protein [Bacteroidia bacterium]
MLNSYLKKASVLLRYRLNISEDKASDQEIINTIQKGVVFKGVNLWTLIFAIIIASIGLDVNSTAVIIGAMLISPLMGPIMGIGLGAGIGNLALLKKAGKNLLIASGIALMTSTTYFVLSPIHLAQSELLARTSPTIWDVLIAFVGGTAGIVASTRKQFNNIIPGVAIATALMPPLCTAGFGLANLEWSYFFGALYLYLINSVFISIATFLAVRFMKINPTDGLNGAAQKKIRNWVGLIAVLTIVPSIYLAYRFVSKEYFTRNATRMINEELVNKGTVVLSRKVIAEKREIQLFLLKEKNQDSIVQVLNSKTKHYNISEARIILTHKDLTNLGLSKEDLMRKNALEQLLQRQQNRLQAVEQEISELKQAAQFDTQFMNEKERVIREYSTLFGAYKEMGIEKTFTYTPDGPKDTVVAALITPFKPLSNKEKKNLSDWLNLKFKPYQVKLILN